MSSNQQASQQLSINPNPPQANSNQSVQGGCNQTRIGSTASNLPPNISSFVTEQILPSVQSLSSVSTAQPLSSCTVPSLPTLPSIQTASLSSSQLSAALSSTVPSFQSLQPNSSVLTENDRNYQNTQNSTNNAYNLGFINNSSSRLNDITNISPLNSMDIAGMTAAQSIQAQLAQTQQILQLRLQNQQLLQLLSQQQPLMTANSQSLSRSFSHNQPHIAQNLVSSHSALSQRQLPSDSPKMAEKKSKKRKQGRNIRKQNEYEIEILESLGTLSKCESNNDVCSNQMYHGEKFHKHYWCDLCGVTFKYDTPAHITRHFRSGIHATFRMTTILLSSFLNASPNLY